MKFDTTKLHDIDNFEQEFTSRLSTKIRVEINNQKQEIAKDLLTPTEQEAEISGENN